jgi:addiction module HigA family antidote
MLPRTRIPTHPGEVLRLEFLEPLGITQVALADHIDVPLQRVHEIVRGKRGVTAATAWLLAGAFDTTPQFWINLQTQHDLSRCKPKRTVRRIGKSA